MPQKEISVRFESVESWEDSREGVDNILTEFTGTSEYPETRSLPPMIFGIEIDEQGVQRLRSLPGVIVKVMDEED
ncbi:hypothetical protein BDV38DRAFT_236613 [Aspergillus pseudotamarii]|uniref:Uncharacterized protein n=1 Tax=Aspergillus pseudotamarii TaxID=132259 RepID=A0A5N6T6F2_ASPPS|nr:uncharacterized protein BDV38DRAFT_236612 [Aspergillus pseudotamarii]XP_031917968.1 uncharacterized protein BDV38DRAFT_236613 [Aspergillus pseudotamarii]KAE8141904.1 hypothetical protein BDV38DRAFT_236612 [Aspergillus pseudotamarii]KAE8141905.1 hypothetical protein BDV38DRAFT_236613 [Aspergillus pseudotamarii]